jgi:PAS domain S-box-containing protein
MPSRSKERRGRASVSEEAVRQAVYDSLPAMIWGCDAAGISTTTNSEWRKFSGLTPRSPVSEWADAVHPDDRARAIGHLERALESRAFAPIEARLRGADGRYHWILYQARPQFGEDGAFLGFIGAAFDITYRKGAEEQLRESDERFRIAAENAGDWVYEWDPETGRRQICGGAPGGCAEANTASWPGLLPLIHAEDRDRVRASLRRAAETGASFELEYRTLRPDGTVRHWLDRGGFVSGHAGPRAIGVLADITVRKQRELSSAWLSTIVDSAEDAIVSTDLNGNVLTWNPGAERLVGYTAAEVVGHPLMSIPPERREEAEAIHLKAVQGSSTLGFETLTMREDGTRLNISLSVSPIRDERGRPVAICIIGHDITAAKKAESEVRESERRLKLALDAGGIGIWQWTLPGEFAASDQYFRIYGRPAGEEGWLYDTWMNSIHPDDRRVVEEYLRRLMSETGEGQCEFRVVWPDGSVHWVLSKGKVQQPEYPAADATAVVGVTLDVTRLRELERAGRQSEERFRLLVEHGMEMIGVLDAAGAISYVSPSVRNVFGYRAEDVIGTNIGGYVHPEDWPAIRSELDAVSASPGISVSSECRLRHSDGGWRHVEAATTNCLDIEGLNGIVVNVRDVTERKRYEEELRISRDQIRRLAARAETSREEERVRIAREIHDEIGQMLSVLKLDVDGLAFEHRPLSAAARARFDEHIARMLGTIDLSADVVRRIAAELRPAILQDLGLAAALQWQLREFESRTGIRSKSRGFDRELPLDPDASLAVFRIVQELLTNVVRHADASAVYLTIEVKRGWFVLLLKDNGKGFDTGQASLGVLGVRERAGLLGGDAVWSSRPRRGTSVRVRIPLRR